MKRLGKQLVTLAMAATLGIMPLAACAGTGSATADDASSPATATQTAPLDATSWTTLGDALANADNEFISYSHNDTYFVCVFHAGDSRIRLVGEMDPSIELSFADLDIDADDYNKQFAGIVGDLKLLSAEDITDQALSQEELNALVGKTGQELLDEGFVFEDYYFYGGEETGANFGKECFAYNITFDTHIDESQTEDGGAAILGATVTAAEGFGNLSNAALDPDTVK